MLRILDKIFGLPLIEERKMSQGFLRRTFLPVRFTVRSDDTYIYYQCAKTCFALTGVVLFLHWAAANDNSAFAVTVKKLRICGLI